MILHAPLMHICDDVSISGIPFLPVVLNKRFQIHHLASGKGMSSSADPSILAPIATLIGRNQRHHLGPSVSRYKASTTCASF